MDSAANPQCPARAGALWLVATGLSLAIAGSVFVAMLWQSYRRAEETRAWAATPCHIVSSTLKPEQTTPHSPTKWRVTVRYDYEAGGQTRSATRVRRGEGLIGDHERALALREAYAPGQATTCWVNPADPTDSVLQHGSRAALYTLWFPLLFVVGGLVMAGRALRAAATTAG